MMHLTACLVLCLVMNLASTKASGIKNLFTQSLRSSTICYFRAHCEGKKKISDPSYECVQSLHFSTWLKIEAFFLQTKGSSHEIDLLYD